MSGLCCKRSEDESWRSAVERIAKVYGLDQECLEIFDEEVGRGTAEAKAAWDALYEWDCLDFVP
jgi:hypothetical protein